MGGLCSGLCFCTRQIRSSRKEQIISVLQNQTQLLRADFPKPGDSCSPGRSGLVHLSHLIPRCSLLEPSTRSNFVVTNLFWVSCSSFFAPLFFFTFPFFLLQVAALLLLLLYLKNIDTHTHIERNRVVIHLPVHSPNACKAGWGQSLEPGAQSHTRTAGTSACCVQGV